jgi:hypothetical protein
MARRELHILSQDILIVLGEGLEAHLFLRCVLVAFTKILADRYGYISTALLPTEKSSYFYSVPKTSPTAITIEFEVAMIASRTVFHGLLVSFLGANNTSNG